MLRGILFTFFCLIITLLLLGISVLIGFALLKDRDRLGRDRVRREFAELVDFEINNFFVTNSKYPEVLRLDNVVTLDTQKLEGIVTNRLTRSNHNEFMVSNEIGTIYCYKNLGNSYAFGVKLETNSWLQYGDISCNEEQAI